MHTTQRRRSARHPTKLTVKEALRMRSQSRRARGVAVAVAGGGRGKRRRSRHRRHTRTRRTRRRASTRARAHFRNKVSIIPNLETQVIGADGINQTYAKSAKMLKYRSVYGGTDMHTIRIPNTPSFG